MPQIGMRNPYGANRMGMVFTRMVVKGGLFDFGEAVGVSGEKM